MAGESRDKGVIRAWQRARWAALPPLERLCLRLAFHLDQEYEQAEHARWNRYERRLPAAAWRWLTVAPPAPLGHRLASRELGCAAARAAFATLAARGLLLQRTVEGDLGPVLEVRLTSLGRRVARAGDDGSAS